MAPQNRTGSSRKGISRAFKNRSMVSFLIGFKSRCCSRVLGGVLPGPNVPRGISRVVAGHASARF